MKPGTVALLCLFLLLTLTACACPAPLPEPAEAQSPGSPDPGIPAGYNLFHDGELCDTVRFVDGKAMGYNNYADGMPVRELENCLVRVVVTFRFEEGSWSLIYSPEMAESFNYYAWVRTEILKAYDRASMEDRLTYPVRLREGTVLTDKNHGGRTIEAQDREYWLARRDGKLYIQMEGGVSCQVDADAVLFPDVVNGEIRWE